MRFALKNETESRVCVRKLPEVSRGVDSQTALTLLSLGRALGFVLLIVFLTRAGGTYQCLQDCLWRFSLKQRALKLLKLMFARVQPNHKVES